MKDDCQLRMDMLGSRDGYSTDIDILCRVYHLDCPVRSSISPPILDMPICIPGRAIKEWTRSVFRATVLARNQGGRYINVTPRESAKVVKAVKVKVGR